MTQDELWLKNYQEVKTFIEANHRRPSKFVPKERNMRSCWKHNKKLLNAGKLKPERMALFSPVVGLGERV